MEIRGLLTCFASLLLWGFCSSGPARDPTKVGTCWAMGDPHYRTFDGQYFTFMGNCTYIMTKNCHVDNNHPEFQVATKNDNNANSKVTSVGMVTISILGATITVVRNEFGYVRVDYEVWSLPISIEKGNSKVELYQSGMSFVMKTDFGLTVQYDWQQYIVITVPDSFAGRVCGLCGNFNGIPGDDLTTPSGSEASSVVALGKSWRVQDAPGDANCRDECSGQCEDCKSSLLGHLEGELFCSLLTHIMEGPFRSCSAVIEPKFYKEMCLYDFCMGEGVKKYLCDTLQVYTDACQRAGVKVHDWRKLARCPNPQCPENSHYEFCGNPCPATCDNPSAPSMCDTGCVETCACNEGYIRSGNQCVLPSECGCQYEGHYVQAGKSFWGDDNCSKRCQCSKTGSKVTCEETSCQNGQLCMVVNGIRDCHPTSYATCLVSGDPHYLTFDGQRYTFQGTCVYQMAGVCSKDATLESFDVLVQNDFQGNRVSSSTKLVEVRVYGQTIVLSKQYPGVVMVNGELANFPVTLANENVMIYKSGLFAVVQTRFGVKISFDWNSVVIVVVPSMYEGAMCGLCGNYNQNPKDDMKMKDGKIAANGTELGQSWRVAEIPGCVHGCKGPCPDCDITQKVQYETNQYCGLLQDPQGPFRNCFSTVDPSGFFEDCLYDVCLYKGQNAMQCKTLTAYTAACQSKGVNLDEWRAPNFCKLNCPANSHYELCPSGCPTTCDNLSPRTDCKDLCQEGCTCNKNFILSGNQCVPFEKCGCTYGGRYYNFGQTFYPHGLCQEECKCASDGKIECKKFSCGANEKCEVKNGIRGCFPVGKGVCTIAGDPHYKTFDNYAYDFQGTCTYVAAKGCYLEGTQLTPFTVVVENEQWYPLVSNKNVSVAKLVALETYGNILILQSHQFGRIMVNGVLVNLPLSLNNGAIQAYQEGYYDVIQTDFGLTIKYDLVYHVIITVPANYEEKTCGLCGNFNGNKNDEFQLPDGKTTEDLSIFGRMWKVTVPDVICADGCTGDFCPKCKDKDKIVYEGVCSIITNPDGPFAACQKVIDPSSYFQDCVYDVCISEGDGKVLCSSIAAYVANCQNFGVEIKSWRTPSFCPLPCPVNSHYEICDETCTITCPGLTDTITCPTTCAEGCACNLGYYFNGTGCVSWDQCSCYANGLTYTIGESIVTENCDEVCTCLPSGVVVCESMQCKASETCQVRNAVRGCYQNQCLLQAGGIFTLFDGMSGTLTSMGAYEFVKVCDDTLVVEWFRVVADLQMCGQTATVAAVYTFFEDMVITVNNKHSVWVNGKIVSLPTVLNDKISIAVVDNSLIIENKSGLLVTYSLSLDLSVTVSDSLSGKVCGACGKISGTNIVITSIQNYMNSWRAPDFPSCSV